MIKTYECISSFEIDKCDEDGFITDEFITIENGEIFQWDSDDQDEYSIKLVNEERWLIIDRNLFEECFMEVGDE